MAAGGWCAGALAGLCREAIDRDSTAVLKFDDGTRIPCDRFIMRTFCGVVRRLLEDSACEADDRGRTVVPVPCQPSAPFWVAVDVLHGMTAVWALGLAETVATIACMEYLGATAYDLGLDARLWHLLKDGSLEAMLPHAPRLLRNPAVAAVVVKRLIQLRPTWAEFREDVLRALEPTLDGVVAAAVVAYAPNFFPPLLVAWWALEATPHLTLDAALRTASQHGVLYHPCESPVLLRKLAAMIEERGWAAGVPGLASLLRAAALGLGTYETVPWAANKCHGSMIKFHDVTQCGVCLALEGGALPSTLKVAPWLKLSFCQDGRFDVAFRPRKIDEASKACTAVQVRVMAFDRPRDPGAGRCAEGWYLFDGVTDHPPDDPHDSWYTLSHAASTLGKPADVSRMLRLRLARQLRLDFFYGKHSVLDNPFDPSSATAGLVGQLLMVPARAV